MKIGAFVDTSKTKQYTEADYVLPEHPPFSWLLKKPKDEVKQENTPNTTTTTTTTTTTNNTAANTTTTEADKNQQNGTATTPTTDESLTSNNNNVNLKGFESGDSGKKLLTQPAKIDVNTSSHSSDGDVKTASKFIRAVPPEDERLLKELVSIFTVFLRIIHLYIFLNLSFDNYI